MTGWNVLSEINREINALPCLLCGEYIAESAGFCLSCLKSLPFVMPPLCNGCGAENDGIFEICQKCLKEEKRPWNRAFALMRMEGAGQELIHRFKYGGETALARAMGELASEKIISAEAVKELDCIVPIPLHWRRRVIRGYNQTLLFAGILSKHTGIPVIPILRRVKATPKQAKLDRKNRLRNLDGAFAVRKGKLHDGTRRILLVDDVMTTGTTLSKATQVLLDNGALKIDVLVLLRA